MKHSIFVPTAKGYHGLLEPKFSGSGLDGDFIYHFFTRHDTVTYRTYSVIFVHFSLPLSAIFNSWFNYYLDFPRPLLLFVTMYVFPYVLESISPVL